jgi:hypothetical protein
MNGNDVLLVMEKYELTFEEAEQKLIEIMAHKEEEKRDEKDNKS